MKNKLYKQYPAYNEGYLQVSDIHKIYYSEAGNPKGIPILHIHGGPGSKSKPRYRRFYNPKKQRVILFDQRGCGKSRPSGELRENTTWDLVDDIEKLRKHLKINKWMVLGGSWGSTLALAYSEKYPMSVKALILRAIFLFRDRDIDWLLVGNELKRIFPDLWEWKVKNLNKLGIDPSKPLKELYEILKSGKVQQKRLAAAILENFGNQFMGVNQRIKLIEPENIEKGEIEGSKILMHYVINKGFFEDNQLIKDAIKIKDIPTVIIHGRYDVVAPLEQAWELHKALPKATFEIVPASGHHSTEPNISKKLIEYTDKFAELYKE